MITFNNVSFAYDNEMVLNDLSFKIEQGEWISIVGHNGSGKSTLIKLLSGIHQPKTGEITVNELTVNEANAYEIHKQMGIVFQNPDNQFVGTTVEMDIAFGLENHGVKTEEMQAIIDHSLELVKMLPFKKHEPHFLSGGQKQRVAIASIIALKPGIIILDEATSMLDPEGRLEVLNVVKTLKEKLNLTVIHITHHLDETLDSDRIFVMNEGHLLLSGPPEEIYQHGETLMKIGLDLPFAMQVYHTFYGDYKFITESELCDLL